MLNIVMAEQNTIGIQWESKNRCVIHDIRGGTLRWKGNAYLVIFVSWILDDMCNRYNGACISCLLNLAHPLGLVSLSV